MEEKKPLQEKKKYETLSRTLSPLNQIWAPTTPKQSQFILNCSRFINNGFWKKCKGEARLQMLVFAWVKAYYPKIFIVHIENEGYRTLGEQYLSTYMGVKAGMPDIMIYKLVLFNDDTIAYCGLAIELKLPNKEPDVNQLECLEALRAAGWYCTICYDFPTTIEAIKKYLS